MGRSEEVTAEVTPDLGARRAVPADGPATADLPGAHDRPRNRGAVHGAHVLDVPHIQCGHSARPALARPGGGHRSGVTDTPRFDPEGGPSQPAGAVSCTGYPQRNAW